MIESFELFQKGINAWLEGPTSNDIANKAIHWTAVAAGSSLGTLNSLVSWGPSGSLAMTYRVNTVTEALNEAARYLMQPNIDGIPINASSQAVTRDTVVTEQMVIAQSESLDKSKEWITDNAAPKPRVWQLEGMLGSISAIADTFLLIKPSLVAQISLLDAYASSRRPVWFKPFYNLFVQVIIESFTYKFDPKAQNAVSVSFTLREFKPYRASKGSISSIILKEVLER